MASTVTYTFSFTPVKIASGPKDIYLIDRTGNVTLRTEGDIASEGFFADIQRPGSLSSDNPLIVLRDATDELWANNGTTDVPTTSTIKVIKVVRH